MRGGSGRGGSQSSLYLIGRLVSPWWAWSEAIPWWKGFLTKLRSYAAGVMSQMTYGAGLELIQAA
jgi:hypothetical protein